MKSLSFSAWQLGIHHVASLWYGNETALEKIVVVDRRLVMH